MNKWECSTYERELNALNACSTIALWLSESTNSRLEMESRLGGFTEHSTFSLGTQIVSLLVGHLYLF